MYFYATQILKTTFYTLQKQVNKYIIKKKKLIYECSCFFLLCADGKILG